VESKFHYIFASFDAAILLVAFWPESSPANPRWEVCAVDPAGNPAEDLDDSPNSESCFKSKFGDENCGDEHLAESDCLGTRLALGYAITPKNLPIAAVLTLSDLVDEHLTNFEAVNRDEMCAGPAGVHRSWILGF